MISKHEPSNDEDEDHEYINNEAMVYFEGEFMCAQDEPERLRKKYAWAQEQLEELKGSSIGPIKIFEEVE